MARNKYPEKTRELILEKAFELFKEKGYEAVVMQDIIDATGFSRGAVYHHFKNKNDILDEVLVAQYKNDTAFYSSMMLKNISAIQRVDEIIGFVTTDAKKREMSFGLWVQNNPAVLFSNLQNTVFKAAPAVAVIVKQGIQEGLCHTEYPLEAAELIMLLLNIWLDPSLFNGTLAQYNSKIDFLLDTLAKMGVPLISNEGADKLRRYYCEYLGSLHGKL